MIASGKRYVYYPSRESTIKLWVLADLHVGNRDSASSLIRRHIKQIADDPDACWIGLGDYADYISPSDRRFDARTVAGTLSISDLGSLGRVLTDEVAILFEPIRHKCLGLAYGNHEYGYMRARDQQDLHAYLCTALGVPNLGYSFFVDVVFARSGSAAGVVHALPLRGRDKLANSWTVRLFGHHGAGAAGTPGGKINRLAKFMETFAADVYLCAHVHEELAIPMARIGADTACGKIVEHQRMGVITGSYLRSYGEGDHAGYWERAGGRPSFLGAAVVEFEPRAKRIRTQLEITA